MLERKPRFISIPLAETQLCDGSGTNTAQLVGKTLKGERPRRCKQPACPCGGNLWVWTTSTARFGPSARLKIVSGMIVNTIYGSIYRNGGDEVRFIVHRNGPFDFTPSIRYHGTTFAVRRNPA